MDNQKWQDDMDIISAIVARAVESGLLAFDRTSLMMDLDVTNGLFDLRLQSLLDADDFNFAHDIIGIQNNLNRQTMEMDNLFVPRYAGH